jgi:tetratricopeptide (TPR) repeat protein
MYGPVQLRPGANRISTSQPGVALGPCVGWSALTAATLASSPGSLGPTQTRAGGEQLVASAPGSVGPWVELRRTYDTGWRLQHHKPTAVADGIFNLYGPVQTAHNGRLTFTFSTMTWQRRGLAITVLVVLAAAVGAWWSSRRERRKRRTERIPRPVEARFAPWIAAGGLAFVALAGLAALLEWFGLPSRLPRIWFLSDPYKLDTLCAEIAVALLVLSVVVRLGENLVLMRRPVTADSLDTAPSKVRRSVGIAAGVSAMAILIAGCSVGGGSANQSLQNAAAAGATSPHVQGATLIDARIQQQAKDAGKCISDYTAALRTYTALVSAYVGRGTCYQSQGLETAAAIHDFTRALSLSPGNPEVLLDRATADQGIGDLQAAANDYKAAGEAPSAAPVDILDAVDGLVAILQSDDAQALATNAEARFPNNPIILAAASDAALAQGEDQAALQDLSQGARLAANSTQSFQLATVLGRVCGYQVLHYQYSAALSSCQRAAVLNVDGSGAFDNLSVADAQLGNDSKAITDITAAIGAFQGNVGPSAQPAGIDGFGLSYLLEARGKMYIEEHEPALAVKDYQAARAALPPGSPDFAARLKADLKTARASF